MEKLILKEPVNKGERTVTELNFAEAKVRHMVATDGFKDKNGYGADMALTEALTGEPLSILGEIGPEDWARVREILVPIYARFLGVTVKDLKEAADPPDQPEAEEKSEASGE